MVVVVEAVHNAGVNGLPVTQVSVMHSMLGEFDDLFDYRARVGCVERWQMVYFRLFVVGSLLSKVP